MKRTVFFISDGTGITAETLGRSLLTQFEQIKFDEFTIPYIDSTEKAYQAVEQINQAYQQDGKKPLIFSTLVNPDIHIILANSQGMLLDFFKTFLDPLELELQTPSSHTIGKTHSIQHDAIYPARINAMNFALGNDDGANIHSYNKADVVLLGVSRCAKTPTCLYLALQFSIFAANYPFTEDDMERLRLPEFLQSARDKLFGLTIEPKRLHVIRSERQPNSRYASLAQCEREIRAVEDLFIREKIPYINTTTRSIEEISTTIINIKGLKRSFLSMK